MLRPLPPPSIQAPRSQGFTLVELIVAAAVGSLVIIATTTVFAPQLRMHQRLEGRTRLQERWARVQFLLDTEIQEAYSVALIPDGLQLTTCAAPDEPSDTYSLATRCDDGATALTGTPGTPVTITYVYNPVTQVLSRNGPSIDCFGKLVTNSSNQGRNCQRSLVTLTPGASILSSGILQFTPSITNQTVNYTLSFRDPLDPMGATFTQKASAARARIKKL